MLKRFPTAPIAAGGLVAGYAVAVSTGSRPAGGLVLAGFGLTCVALWRERDGAKTATLLTLAGLVGFAASHALGPLIGPWPAVLIVAAVTAGLCWQVSDVRHGWGRRLAA